MRKTEIEWIPIQKELPTDYGRHYVTLYKPKTQYKFCVDTRYYYPETQLWERREFSSFSEMVIAWAKMPPQPKMAAKIFVARYEQCDEEIDFGARGDPEGGWSIKCELSCGHEGAHQASDTEDSEQPFVLKWLSTPKPEPYKVIPDMFVPDNFKEDEDE